MLEQQQKTAQKQHKFLEQQHKAALQKLCDFEIQEQKRYKELQSALSSQVQHEQAVLQKQWEQAVERIRQANNIEQCKQEALRKQAEAFVSLLNNHAKELSSQTQGIHKLMESFKGESQVIAQSMSSSVKAVNQSISDSVRVAEDNITALIGVANGKLR